MVKRSVVSIDILSDKAERELYADFLCLPKGTREESLSDVSETSGKGAHPPHPQALVLLAQRSLPECSVGEGWIATRDLLSELTSGFSENRPSLPISSLPSPKNK